MNRLLLATAFLVGTFVYWEPLRAVAAVLWALAAISVAYERHPAPRPIAPTPAQRSKPGWRWGFGLGVTTWGPFPFITVRRRR